MTGSKIHYANESWSVSICGVTIPTEQMTWRFADVTCKSCLRNRAYKRDLESNKNCLCNVLED